MGTSDFGCELLQNLIEDKNLEIIAVYTKEPSIAGRGKKFVKSAIHELSLRHNLKVITPKNFKNTKSVEEFRDLNADLAIVISFGLILPKDILSGTKYGCINIHPSKLPKWRGAAPMQRALISGDKKSAMTIIKMNEQLDAGDIIFQEEFDLDKHENFITLSQKMSNLAVNLTQKTIEAIKGNNLKLSVQNHQQATYASKILKEECRIDWNDKAQNILQKIRGLNGNLGAFFEYNGEKFKILEANIIYENYQTQAGTIINKDFIIKCQDFAIKPILIQRSGKKPMNIKDLLLGFKPKIGEILT